MTITDDSKDKLYQAFRDQEGEINDLVRLADLALYLCRDEVLENVKVSEHGSTTFMIVETLRDSIARFREDYYKTLEA
jgi:hypothetical protein